MVDCHKPLKYFLIVCNVILMIVGALQFGFAIRAISSNPTIEGATQDTVKMAAIILIIVGIVTFCVSFLGFWGSFKENACLLNIYGGILLALVILEIATFIYTITMEARYKRRENHTYTYMILIIRNLCLAAAFALATSIKKQAARV